jgi:hypothetical protein
MWLVMNIGCIECGVSSAVVGLFKTKEDAEVVAESCKEKYSWREGGQNEFEVFKLPREGKVAKEYDLKVSLSEEVPNEATGE